MDASTKWFVYALRDPMSLDVRYIGITANPITRLRKHLYSTRSNAFNHEIVDWIESLQRQLLIPAMTIIVAVDSKAKALKREELEIRAREDSGLLLNIHHHRDCLNHAPKMPDLDGKPASVAAWAKHLGISRQRLFQRITAYGLDKAISRGRNEACKERLFDGATTSSIEAANRLSHKDRAARRMKMAEMYAQCGSCSAVASHFSVTEATVKSAVREASLPLPGATP